MGHIKRYITCVAIDHNDTFAYCGTRTGDLLEISIDKAAFNRVGPLHRLFLGGISQILASSGADLTIGAGDGTIARVGKKTMKVEE